MALPAGKLVRPFHILELKDEFGTGGAFDGDTVPIDISADKAAFETDRNTTIDTFRAAVLAAVTATSLSSEDKAALMADIDADIVTMKASLSTDLDNNLPDTYNVSGEEALNGAYDVFSAEDESVNGFPCPQCGTNGKVLIYDAAGVSTGEYRECPLSDGYGYTSTEKKVDPNSLQYIDA